MPKHNHHDFILFLQYLYIKNESIRTHLVASETVRVRTVLQFTRAKQMVSNPKHILVFVESMIFSFLSVLYLIDPLDVLW